MTLQSTESIERLLDLVQSKDEYLAENTKLLEIFKGRLKPYVDAALGSQLSGQAYEQARKRIPPINVLRRIVEKQSKIYSQGVTRNVQGGDLNDQAMLSWYIQNMQPDRGMSLGNSYFNLFKNCLIGPYLSANGKPALRIIPSDRFVPYSDFENEDEKPTGYVLKVGKKLMPAYGRRRNPKQVMVYMAIDNNELVYFTDEKQNVTSLYAPNNPMGINSYGRTPFVYVNKDPDCLLPTQDTDTFAMTILIPILLTDINFAHMFQAFSIVYGINVSDQGIKFAPNALWMFKTEPGSDAKPEIGTLSPQANISGGLDLVASQFALWLNTRGIKPGDIGQVNGANFSSGIAKILDEMDTSEDRNQQIPFFAAAETELWDLILNHMHPQWRFEGLISQTGIFSTNAKVVTNFAEQVPNVRRGAVVDEITKERDAGFTTTKRAIQRLNPQMTAEEVDDLLEEISDEEDKNKNEENGNGAKDE